MSMAVTDTASATSEARAALSLLSEVNAEIARLRTHLARLASTEPIDSDDQLALAYQARKNARTLVAMAKGIERDTMRAVHLAKPVENPGCCRDWSQFMHGT